MSEPFLGEIRMNGFNFAQRGWAFCDGQIEAISQNTALFSLLGIQFGGDGRTTFALPNLKDRIPMHAGDGPGLTSRTQGQTGGSRTVTLTQAQIPSHNHDHIGVQGTGDHQDPAGRYLASGGRGVFLYAGSATQPTAMASDILSNEGGGQVHDNMPTTLTVYFSISLSGVYPSRG